MSEDTGLDDRPHSAATDPHATVAAGELPDNWHPSGPPRAASSLSEAERDHNRQMFGITYRERHGLPEHAVCVAYCRNPGQRRHGARCPSCYEKIDIRPIGSEDIEPVPTRAERFAAWAGGWAGAFLEAAMFPFRVGRAHTEAMVRDILQQAMAAGLRAEIVQVCPKCQATGEN